MRWGRFNRWICLAIFWTVLLTGCAGPSSQPTGFTAGEPGDAIIAPLAPARQDMSLKPKLIWLPRDNTAAFWWTGVVSDGWVGAGQHYAGSQGMHRRIDYYRQDGSLKWSFIDPDRSNDSDVFQCAARRSDGILIVGGRRSDGSNPEVGSLTAFSNSGQILWETLIDDPSDENLGLSVSQCLIAADNQMLAVINVNRYNDALGTQPAMVACLDASGKLIWLSKLDFSGVTYAQCAVLDGEGGLYLAVNGFSRTSSQLSREYNWLVQVDQNGKENWRRPLTDLTYQYQVNGLACDSDGNLYLSCAARYSGSTPTPTPVADSQEFHDRYRSLAIHPAALLKLNHQGEMQWKYFLNGEFGAAGGQAYCNGRTVYWRLTLTDDIVPPYLFMSIDHRAVTHEVLAVLDPGSKAFRFCQFGPKDSGAQLIQRLENGQPVLIGIEPFIPPKEWATETFR